MTWFQWLVQIHWSIVIHMLYSTALLSPPMPPHAPNAFAV